MQMSVFLVLMKKSFNNELIRVVVFTFYGMNAKLYDRFGVSWKNVFLLKES